MNNTISLKRLTDKELHVLRSYMAKQKEFNFEMIDKFMEDQHKANGLFENCTAIVNKQHFIIQRPIGW